MIRIEKMYMSPVKSMALVEVTRAYLDKPGIAGDRAFYVVGENGELVTQRQVGKLVQLQPAYDVASGELRIAFPDGTTLAGVPAMGEAVSTPFFGERAVAGHVVAGDWNEALSEFAGRPVRLVKADVAGSSFDGFPLSMCSTASLEALAKAAEQDAVDGRRFRQNIYISGSNAHEEDTWVGREVRVGEALVRVKQPDERCAVTAHDPETGEIDMNTLKIIGSYRTDQPGEINFGVYCTVAEAGEASLGDEVKLA